MRSGRPNVDTPPQPRLFVLRGQQQGAVFALSHATSIVGRDETAEISLTDETISRKHARLGIENGSVYVEDLASSNGTFVNGQRIEERTRLLDGDYVGLGANTIAKFCLMRDLEAQTLRTLFELTLRDSLTHLYNRRYFDERLQSEFSYARRSGTPLALLIVDIDHFKAVNDTWGHPAGDSVLKAVATCMRRLMRPEDVLARYGGEEFVVIARGAALENALLLAERIRRAVEHLEFPSVAADLRVTVSVGVTRLGDASACPSSDDLVASADAALYRAKRAGRNRVAAARLPEEPSAAHSRPVPLTLPPPAG